MNELKSYTEYAVSTPTADFVIGFDFNYGEDAVNVTVDNVPATEAGYTVVYLNETTIRLSPSVPSGVVRLQRETDIDQTDHAYRAGAKFIAQTMDENFEQLRHSQQEVRDGFVKLADDTYEIIDTLNEVGQSAQAAADAAEVAAQLANNAAAQVNDKVSQAELDLALTPVNSTLDLAKRGIANRYDSSLTYNSGERVVLTNGDIVKSTTDENTNNPNAAMAGWVKTNSAGQIFDESGLSQQEVNNRLLKSKTIDLTYLTPPENFDFTTILNATLQLSQQHPIYLILPCGSFKITDSITTGATGKGCILDLNGSTIYVDKRSELDQKLNGHEYNSVILYSTTDAPCAVINGVIDGSRREQNLFRETDYPTLLDKITNGVFISAKTIAFDGLKLRHMYGQTSKFENANLVNIKDSEITDCGGHWYQNNSFDAFGDSFYIKAGESGQQNIQVNIERTKVIAKSSDQYPENSTMFPTTKYSRIGITLESLEAGISSNLKMTIRDSSFDKVERFIHQEQLLNSSILIENSVVNSVVTFGAYLTETMEVVSNKSDYKMLIGDYNGSKGLARQYSSDYLSVVLNDGSIDGNNLEYTFGNGANSTVLNNVKTINVNGHLAENPSGLAVNGGSIKYNDTPSTGWLMGLNGDYKLDGVTLDATATTLREFNYGVPTSVKNCVFKNMLIGRGFEVYYNKRNFFNNQLYMDFSGYADYFGSSYEINDLAGNLLREECLMWGADRDIGVKGLFTHNTVARSSGGVSLNLIGANELILGKKRPLVLVVVRASANPEFFAINEIDSSATKAFYVAVAKYDATTNTYSIVKPFVASHSTPTFTLAFTNLTVNTFGAGVTNVHWAVLPYDQIGTLPVIDSSLIL